MGGVESTPTGFVIVKGKGAPSVNVNGYTQYAELEKTYWQECNVLPTTIPKPS